MTKTEYAKYEQIVADFFDSEGISNLSQMYCDEYNPLYTEFSKRQCDCCGTHLAGARYEVNAYCERDREIKEYEVCQDCLYYAEYGKLDDMTMMDLKD